MSIQVQFKAMIYRKVKSEDILGILRLYKECFNIKVKEEYYDYLNKDSKGNYYSMIAVDDNKIVAHNSIILNQYIINNDEVIVGLSSGGMVSENYSGVFYTLLKKQFKLFEGDIIIAFPNKNSSPFFTKLFKFETINQNYYNLDYSDFQKNNHKNLTLEVQRTDSFIEKRVHKHLINNYKIIQSQEKLFIYKEFGNEIDIIFSSHFDVFFESTIEALYQKGYNSFNIVHWNENYIRMLGFKPSNNNIFVYKSFKNNIKFQPQMIDSDVF